MVETDLVSALFHTRSRHVVATVTITGGHNIQPTVSVQVNEYHRPVRHLFRPLRRHFRIFSVNFEPRIRIYPSFRLFKKPHLCWFLVKWQRIKHSRFFEMVTVHITQQHRITSCRTITTKQYVRKAILVIITCHQWTVRGIFIKFVTTRIGRQAPDSRKQRIFQNLKLPIPLINH